MGAFRTAGLAALVVAMWAGAAEGAGPEVRDIPADAKAYLHFDTSLIRESKFLKAFRAEMGARNPLDQGLDAINTVIGVDLLEDMDGLTYYTPTLADGEGVVLVYGKVNVDEVLKRVEAFPQHLPQDHGAYKIHTWFDQQKNATVAGVVLEKMILWADTVERMKTALDVIDGKKDGKYAPAMDYPKGAMFGAAVSDMKAFAKKPDQEVFALATFFEISLAEDKKGALTAAVTAGMADAEQAGQVKQVADGLKAFVALSKEKYADLAKLTATVKTEADGTRARVSVERPAETVFADIKKIQAAMGSK